MKKTLSILLMLSFVFLIGCQSQEYYTSTGMILKQNDNILLAVEYTDDNIPLEGYIALPKEYYDNFENMERVFVKYQKSSLDGQSFWHLIGIQEINKVNNYSFIAQVTSVLDNNTVIVSCTEDIYQIINPGSFVRLNSNLELNIGNMVKITYCGTVMETYPLALAGEYTVELLD